MADKMKKAKPIIRGYQDMWWVHKKRNALAHDITAEVNPRDADRALRILKRVLKGLKAI
jgi:hypothetical protein